MNNVVVPMLLFLLLAAGLIAGQIALSLQTPSWPGLVLPFLGLVVPLVLTVSRLIYSVDTGGGMVLIGMLLFLMASLPSLVGLAVYGVCRARVREKEKWSVREEELNRMTHYFFVTFPQKGQCWPLQVPRKQG